MEEDTLNTQIHSTFQIKTLLQVKVTLTCESPTASVYLERVNGC